MKFARIIWEAFLVALITANAALAFQWADKSIVLTVFFAFFTAFWSYALAKAFRWHWENRSL